MNKIDEKSMLFCTICNLYPDISWKCRDNVQEGKFIAGIYTPLGQASFHLSDKYWDQLHVSEAKGTDFCDDLSEKEMEVRVFSLGELVGSIKRQKKEERTPQYK